MKLSTIQWDIDILARASIVHREDYSSVGSDNFALFRREKIITPSGGVIQVPIVSGSSFRGILRRIGEELTAAHLDYEGSLPIPAAHLLTNGGRLAKSAHPLTDEQERRLKNLLPPQRDHRLSHRRFSHHENPIHCSSVPPTRRATPNPWR